MAKLDADLVLAGGGMSGLSVVALEQSRIAGGTTGFAINFERIAAKEAAAGFDNE